MENGILSMTLDCQLGLSAKSTQAFMIVQFAFDENCAGRCVCASANCKGHLEGCGAPRRAATWLLVCEVIAPGSGGYDCGQVTYTLWGNGGGQSSEQQQLYQQSDHPPDRGHLTCHSDYTSLYLRKQHFSRLRIQQLQLETRTSSRLSSCKKFLDSFWAAHHLGKLQKWLTVATYSSFFFCPFADSPSDLFIKCILGIHALGRSHSRSRF